MADLIKKFKNIFEPEIYLDILPNNCVTIREEKNVNKQGSLVELKVTNIPENSVAITLDLNPTNDEEKKRLIRRFGSEFTRKLSWPINKGVQDVNKKCDFAIISLDGKACKILLGELKSSSDWRDYQTQLINSRVYIEYVMKLLGVPRNLEIKLEYHLVVFIKSRGDKKNGKRIKRFYGKRQILQFRSNNYQSESDPIPMLVEAPSGNANWDYSTIAGN